MTFAVETFNSNKEPLLMSAVITLNKSVAMKQTLGRQVGQEMMTPR